LEVALDKTNPNILVHKKDEFHVYRVNLIKRTVEYTTSNYQSFRGVTIGSDGNSFGYTFEDFLKSNAMHFENIFGNFHLNKVREIIKTGKIISRTKTANEIIDYVNTHNPGAIDTDGEFGVLIDAVAEIIDRRLPHG